MYIPQSRNGGCTLTKSMLMRLTNERETRKLTLHDTARSIGVTADHFRRIERGQCSAKYELVQLWANVLGFNVELKLTTAKVAT